MKVEHKPIIQDTIDRLQYCSSEYMKELEVLNKKYNPHEKVNYSTDPSKFRFPIEAAI